MVRYVILPFAIVIDALEILIEMSMTALGAIGGGALLGGTVGAAACAKLGIGSTGICAATGAAIGGIVGFFANETGLGEAAGFVMGYILTLAVTLLCGTILVVILAYATKGTGQMRWGYTGLIFLLKIFPVIGIAPGWTKYAWDMTKNNKEELSEARDYASAVTGGYSNTEKPRERQMRDMEIRPLRQPNEQAA